MKEAVLYSAVCKMLYIESLMQNMPASADKVYALVDELTSLEFQDAFMDEPEMKEWMLKLCLELSEHFLQT